MSKFFRDLHQINYNVLLANEKFTMYRNAHNHNDQSGDDKQKSAFLAQIIFAILERILYPTPHHLKYIHRSCAVKRYTEKFILFLASELSTFYDVVAWILFRHSEQKIVIMVVCVASSRAFQTRQLYFIVC